MSNDLAVQPAIVIFDKGRAEACGVAPVGVADPTFFAPVTKVQRDAGGVRGVTVNDAGQMVSADGTVGGVPVGAVTDELTGKVKVFAGGNDLTTAVSLRAFGLKLDGVADETAKFVSACAAMVGGHLVIPDDGILLLNNSAAPVTISGQSGKISGGGQIKFTSLANHGLVFDTPQNFQFSGLRLSFQPAKTTRNSSQLLVFKKGSAVQVSDVRLSNGNSSALVIEECTLSSAEGIWMDGFLANGLLITNSSDLHVSRVFSNAIEDAAIEVSYYDSLTHNAECARITISKLISKSSWIGILLNSCQDVTVDNFIIDDTKYQGVLITQDTATTTTKFPNNISVSGGRIRNVGSIGPTASQNGVHVYTSSAPPSDIFVKVSDVSVVGATGDGISASADNSQVNLSIGSLEVKDVTGVGARLGGKVIDIGFLSVERSGMYGLLASSGTSFKAGNISIKNAQTGGTDTRAYHFSSWDSVQVGEMLVEDDRATPLAYGCSDAGVTAGNIFLRSRIKYGAVTKINGSTGLIYNAVDAGGDVPVVVKKTIDYTNAVFKNNWNPQEALLMNLPAKAKVLGITIKHSAAFTDGAGAMTQVTVSVGTDASQTFYTTAVNVGEATPVSATAYGDFPQYKSLTSAAHDIYAIFNATGRNFGDMTNTFLTGGSVDIWICYVVLP